MIKKNKLTKTERLEIELFLNKKYSMRAVAKMLGRSPNSISYEVTHNSMKNGYYDGKKADAKARLKKRMAKYQSRKIDKDFQLQKYIIEKLKEGLNPDEISGLMRKDKEKFYASKTNIYD
jgi:IS30 family transposase